MSDRGGLLQRLYVVSSLHWFSHRAVHRHHTTVAWKTWSGRSSGSSEFEWMDLLRGSKRVIERTLLKANPSTGATCPVCFCQPEPDEWHITSSCSHAVCLDCLRAYASSQINDPLHTGPLKCPVCPQPLRRKDAVIALRDNAELVEKWDEKLRNQLLRALPSYRPCPKCSSVSKSALGGGFVTSQCLAPQYEERRETATVLLNYGNYASLLCFAVVALFNVWISVYSSASPLVDLFFMLVPIAILNPNIKYIRRKAAEKARQALFQPISVECPCCEDSFILPASSTNADIVDAESKQWIDRHSRRCPSCSVPISKNGGCNHITCQNCKANFCWACMRLRTSCRAYDCHNGARFGNAVPLQGDNIVGNADAPDSLLNRIDSVLQDRGRTMTTGPPVWQNGAVLLFMMMRRYRFVQQPIEWVMITLATIFASGVSSWAIIGVMAWHFHRRWLQNENRRRLLVAERRAAQRMDHHDAPGVATIMPHRRDVRTMTAAEFLLGGTDEGHERDHHVRMVFRTEAEMTREAIRRSLVEQ